MTSTPNIWTPLMAPRTDSAKQTSLVHWRTIDPNMTEEEAEEAAKSFYTKDWILVSALEIPHQVRFANDDFNLPFAKCVFEFLDEPDSPVLYLQQNKFTKTIKCMGLHGLETKKSKELYEQYRQTIVLVCKSLARGSVVLEESTHLESASHSTLQSIGHRLYELRSKEKTTQKGTTPAPPLSASVWMHNLSVDTDYHSLLTSAMVSVYEREVQLPFEYCSFTLNYEKSAPTLYLHQNQETGSITALTSSGSRVSRGVRHQFIQHVYAVCIALDTNIAKKVIRQAPHLPTNPNCLVGDSYEVVDIKGSNLNSNKLHLRRGHYVRRNGKRFWRRWSIASTVLKT